MRNILIGTLFALSTVACTEDEKKSEAKEGKQKTEQSEAKGTTSK